MYPSGLTRIRSIFRDVSRTLEKWHLIRSWSFVVLTSNVTLHGFERRLWQFFVRTFRIAGCGVLECHMDCICFPIGRPVPFDLSRVKVSFKFGETWQKKCFLAQRDPAIPVIHFVNGSWVLSLLPRLYIARPSKPADDRSECTSPESADCAFRLACGCPQIWCAVFLAWSVFTSAAYLKAVIRNWRSSVLT